MCIKLDYFHISTYLILIVLFVCRYAALSGLQTINIWHLVEMITVSMYGISIPCRQFKPIQNMLLQ